MGQNFSLAELKVMALAVFPAGTLPDESSPIEFTNRELEIFRHLQWMTDETKRRWMCAEVDRVFCATETERRRLARRGQSG
jgi:hypothetical protein